MRRRQTSTHDTAKWAASALAAVVCLVVCSAGFAVSPSPLLPVDKTGSMGWWRTGGGGGITCSVDLGLGSLEAMLSARYDRAGLSSSTSGIETTSTADPPCSTPKADGHASNNVCLEQAGVPATVRPDIIAEYRTAQHSRLIAGIAKTFAPDAGEANRGSRSGDSSGTEGRELLGLTWRADEVSTSPNPVAQRLLEAWTSAAADVPPKMPRDESPAASCSVAPVQCESVPPGPPGIDAELSPPADVKSPLRTSNRESRDDVRHTSHQSRVGPSDGHGSPPDRPPQVV